MEQKQKPPPAAEEVAQMSLDDLQCVLKQITDHSLPNREKSLLVQRLNAEDTAKNKCNDSATSHHRQQEKSFEVAAAAAVAHASRAAAGSSSLSNSSHSPSDILLPASSSPPTSNHHHHHHNNNSFSSVSGGYLSHNSNSKGGEENHLNNLTSFVNTIPERPVSEGIGRRMLNSSMNAPARKQEADCPRECPPPPMSAAQRKEKLKADLKSSFGMGTACYRQLQQKQMPSHQEKDKMEDEEDSGSGASSAGPTSLCFGEELDMQSRGTLMEYRSSGGKGCGKGGGQHQHHQQQAVDKTIDLFNSNRSNTVEENHFNNFQGKGGLSHQSSRTRTQTLTTTSQFDLITHHHHTIITFSLSLTFHFYFSLTAVSNSNHANQGNSSTFYSEASGLKASSSMNLEGTHSFSANGLNR